MTTDNPFVHLGMPVTKPADFYGRQRLTRSTLSLLRKGQGCSVIGPRRIGKTSFVTYLKGMLALQPRASAGGSCFVHVNCQNWQNLTPIEFYQRLFKELSRDLAAAPRQHVVMLTPPAGERQDDFHWAIRDAAHAIAEDGETKDGDAKDAPQLIFALDEFESLAQNPHLDVEFYGGLRSLYEESVRAGERITFVTASRKPLTQLEYAHPAVLTDPNSSPFFNVFTSASPGLFSRAEAEALLVGTAAKGGMAFEPYLDFLIDLAGLHPLLLQIAGHHAFDYLAEHDGQLDGPGRQSITEQFFHEATVRIWDPYWTKLATHDQRFLALLPEGGQPVEPWSENDQKLDPEKSAQKTLKRQAEARLKEACLAYERDGLLLPLSPAFRAFVRQQQVNGLIQLSYLILDLDRRKVLLHGHEVALPKSEYRLLECLARAAGEVVPHQVLFEHVYTGERWERGLIGNKEKLKTLVRALNMSLKAAASAAGWTPPHVESERGEGYSLRL